jgi:hypothetical protein
MTVGNKWLQYLTALSLSLPAVAHALPPTPSTARPVTVSAAATAKLQAYAAAGTVVPDAKPRPNPWGQITWIQEGWANWARAADLKTSGAQASLDQVPSLAGLLDDVTRNG